MQCVILAGGLGTRMRPLTDRQPKALVPVAGEPFAHHQLTLLAAEGITDVVYSVGHLGEQVAAFVGDGGRWGLSIRVVHEGEHLLGTAGALRVALDQDALEDEFLVLYGDSYLPIRYRPVADAFRASGQPALMTVLRNDDRWDASNVWFEDGRIRLYDKARRAPEAANAHHIDYGLGALDRRLIEDRVPPAIVTDLADLYHELSLEGRLAGFEVDQRFYEVGSPAGLADLEAHLREVGAAGSA